MNCAKCKILLDFNMLFENKHNKLIYCRTCNINKTYEVYQNEII